MTIEVPSNVLATAIHRVWHARAKDYTRPILNSVLLEETPAGFFAVAADNYRLAQARALEYDPPREEASWGQAALPGDDIPLLLAFLRAEPKATAKLDLEVGIHRGSKLAVTLRDKSLVLQVVMGEYPTYRSVLDRQLTRPRRIAVRPDQIAASMAAAGRGYLTTYSFLVGQLWDDPLRISGPDYLEVIMPVKDGKEPLSEEDPPYPPPVRRQLDGSPCWCFSTVVPHVGWVHSPTCLHIRSFVADAAAGWIGQGVNSGDEGWDHPTKEELAKARITYEDPGRRLVAPGQRWKDNDPRSADQPPFTIGAVEPPYARIVRGNGKLGRILLRRFALRGHRGYTQVE